MKLVLFSRAFVVFAVALATGSSHAWADSVIYQNTTTAVGELVLNGAAPLNVYGDYSSTNIDLNELFLAPGSAGASITSISFQAANFNSSAVEVRADLNVYAAGSNGLPDLFIAGNRTPVTLAPGVQSVTFNNFFGLLNVPSTSILWLGISFDNCAGFLCLPGTPATVAQLNELGGYTYNPATIGGNGAQAYYLSGAEPNGYPTLQLATLGDAYAADYGWTVSADVATPEPHTFGLTLLSSAMVITYRRRWAVRR